MMQTMKPYIAVFVSVFLAELGDKTQLATLLFATDPSTNRGAVFLAAAGALCLSTALAVVVGAVVGGLVPPRVLRVVAGAGFIAIGVWMLASRV
jgi:putative Ca2+/H+ antiporter (TMEM165/GDT1 family)